MPIIKINPNIKGEYKRWNDNDILTPVKKLIGHGVFMNEYGKLKFSHKAVEVDTPWLHSTTAPERDCGLWHSIMFDCYGILPSPCLECWKVVVSVKTLKDLFALLGFQRDCGHPSKCGIEVRPYTPRIYGGYFYNSSLDEGQKTWRWVKDWVDENLSKGTEVTLKRACTEFEMVFGASNNWIISGEELDKEERITNLFERSEEDVLRDQPSALTEEVKMKWIRWAFQCGDPTYKDFTGGESLYSETVKYHDLDLSKLEKKQYEFIKAA